MLAMRWVLLCISVSFFGCGNSNSFSGDSQKNLGKKGKNQGAGAGAGDLEDGDDDVNGDDTDGDRPGSVRYDSDGNPIPRDSSDGAADGLDEDGITRIRTFKLNQKRPMLDMVWIIDNSPSMTEEASEVRRNFSAFTSSLDKSLDIKLALISETAETVDTGVTLTKREGFTQVPVHVGSTNPLALLGASLCAADKTNPGSLLGGASNRKVCDVAVESLPVNLPIKLDIGLESGEDVKAISGKLTKFFRPEASIAFVVVTDDDALGIKAKQFSQIKRNALGNRAVSMYAFRGNDASDCEIARPGIEYDTLAKQFSGATFDLCAPDWSQNFAKLSNQVISTTQREFTVDGISVSVVEVQLDGKKLPPSAYEVDAGTITIDEGIIAASSKAVTVKYRE